MYWSFGQTTAAGATAERGPGREATRAYLGARPALVSVHEQAGAERIHHPDDVRYTRHQSVPDLMALLGVLGGGLLPGTSGVVAAVIAPMPYYRRFKPAGAPIDPAACGRVIRERNRELLDSCARFRSGHPPSAGLPLPALMADPFREAAAFATDYAGRLGEVFALKWHPSAAERSVATFVERGYLDLAADLGVPTLLHCPPDGDLGDLAEIAATAVPAAAAAGARTLLVHPGADSPVLPRLLGGPGVFAAPRAAGSEAGLVRLLAAHGERLAVSFDAPWHLPYRDGACGPGAGTVPAYRRILGAPELDGTDPHPLLAGNALRLLFGAA
ncbi:hypothetical protein ACFU3J_08515 [Streptomyces sp. NPDC057411]|uniref:hypothetical protein n=1 Tax=unclassified Streptomyces TaxID=2593676 RepID=UPI0036364348